MRVEAMRASSAVRATNRKPPIIVRFFRKCTICPVLCAASETGKRLPEQEVYLYLIRAAEVAGGPIGGLFKLKVCRESSMG